jgi:hypothetical protein
MFTSECQRLILSKVDLMFKAKQMKNTSAFVYESIRTEANAIEIK